MILELDRFKTVNDGYGPDVGDELLLITGRRIQECLNREDSATRLTGSQFAIAYSEIAHPFGEDAFAAELMQAIVVPIPLASGDVVLSASIGVSMRGLSGVVAEELLAQATSALHAAKLDGLGHVAVYDAGMRNDRVAQVALEADLRQAISRAEIEVHYQPITNLVTRKIAGFEALARWRHPSLGLIAPEQFIDTAEEAGLIGELGRLVLSEAARQLGIWQRTVARNKSLFVAVNVSASHLLEDEFIATVQHIMQRETLMPDSLKIEVTEAVVMRYPERVLSLFGMLRNLGAGISCDDFGTGFSSLSILRDLPFDTLKMDRSFLTDDPGDERASHIIRSVLDMAHGLGMTVVSEGIETAEQVESLTHLGCDFAQGFYFGSATTAAEAESYLTDLPYLAVIPPARMPQQNYSQHLPMPGQAPMAPRRRRTARKVSKKPEELPSIYQVSRLPEPQIKIEPEPPPAPVLPVKKLKKKANGKAAAAQAKARKKKR